MRFISDGVIQLRHASSVANPAAPTAAEWNAAEDLTGFMISLDTPLDGSAVDVSDASSKYNKTASGTYGGQPVTAEFYRDSNPANDTAWNDLPRGTGGYFLVARRGGSGVGGAVQAGDKIDVIPIDVITRNPTAYARNEAARFAVSAAVPDEPEEDVAVA